MAYYVYILASKTYGTLYVGCTSSLRHRIWQHRENIIKGFTKRYSIHRLVHVEVWPTAGGMVQRERRIKKWKRKEKIKLIEKNNPTWKDLYHTIL